MEHCEGTVDAFQRERENQRGCDLPGMAEGGKILGSAVSSQSPNACWKPGIMDRRNGATEEQTRSHDTP